MLKKTNTNLKNAVLAAILVLCMAFSMCVPAFAAQTSGTCGDGLTWSFDAGTLTVEGVGTIPDYNSDAASEDAAPWAELRSKIKSLVISDEITSIGKNVFYGLENLTAITIPNSVTHIGANAFYNCVRVKELTIGENVTDMADYAFAYLKSLRTLHYNAISARAALEQKQLEDGAAYIFSSVFYAAGVAGKGVEVIFGDKVVTVPPYIFGRQEYNTSGGQSSNSIKSNVKLLKIWKKRPVFRAEKPYPLNKITTVRFGTSVEYIDECAFAYCDTLKSITFSESIQYIGSHAFSCGTSDVQLNFPNDSCFAAITVRSCEDKPGVKTVSATATSFPLEFVHLVDHDDPFLTKVVVTPIEASINLAEISIIGTVGLIGAIVVGIGIGISELAMEAQLIVLLPVLPAIWISENLLTMGSYYSGYLAHIML